MKTLNDEFIPYEEALVLKELGFNEPCFGYYDNPENPVWVTLSPPYYANKENVYLAPLYQQAFRFFRNKGYDFAIFDKHKDLGGFYGGYIKKKDLPLGVSYGSNYKTYEEAELACLQTLIKIIKDGNI